MSILYRTQVTATGGREGRARSADGVLDVALALPKELGGPGHAATNPEQLFAAGYASCFENAVKHVARAQRIQIGQTSVTADVGIGPRPAGGFGLDVALAVTVAGIDQKAAETLVAAAHQVCPYSNATRGNLDVRISVAAA